MAELSTFILSMSDLADVKTYTVSDKLQVAYLARVEQRWRQKVERQMGIDVPGPRPISDGHHYSTASVDQRLTSAGRWATPVRTCPESERGRVPGNSLPPRSRSRG